MSPDCERPGSANETRPSIVLTKFAKTQGRSEAGTRSSPP